MGFIFHPEQRKWELEYLSLTKERGGAIFHEQMMGGGGVYFSNKGGGRNISRKKEWGAIFHSKHRKMEQFFTNQGGMEGIFPEHKKLEIFSRTKKRKLFSLIKEVRAISHSKQRKWELFFTTKKGNGSIFHEQRNWVLFFIPNKGKGCNFSRTKEGGAISYFTNKRRVSYFSRAMVVGAICHPRKKELEAIFYPKQRK